MNKSKLTGWKNVFTFTLTQTAKSKSFLSSTIIMGVIVIVLMLGINVYSAMNMKSEEEAVTTVNQNENKPEQKKVFAHTIYFLDETGLGFLAEDIEANLNKKYDSIAVVPAEKSHDDMMEQTKTDNTDVVYLHLSMDGSGLAVNLYLPTGSSYEEESETVCYRIANYIDQWKDETLGLTKEQKDFLSASIMTSVNTGDDHSLAEMYVKMYVPMMMCLVLYLAITLYGQMVGTSVATEKSSKVMELLLTSVRPLAIIVGKVLSMMALSLIQIFGYILLILIGNEAGTIIGQNIHPGYTNIVSEVLTEFDLMSMFSPVRILLALLVFILGFTFYCTLAGLMGATVNRGEDLSSAMSVYTTISVIGFMIAYLPNVLGTVSTGFQAFGAIFPLSAPFILPASILTGDIGWGAVTAGILLLAVVVVVFIIVVSKIYEMVILYSGNKIGLKEMRKFLRAQE